MLQLEERLKDMREKLVKITLPWFISALVLPLIMVALFTAKPAEAG